MKTFINRGTFSIFCLVLILSATGRFAFAHDLWLEVRDYTPQQGEEISLMVAYDHHFPTRVFMDKDDLGDLHILDPKGKSIGIQAYSALEYKTDKTLKAEGTYLIVADKKGKFFTKTTEGYKRGVSKKGLDNVISCTYSAKYSKAIVNAGKAGGQAFLNEIGHDLEIIPVIDPGVLIPGDYLSVKVLFKGKPLPSSQVRATYMGFSTEKDTFAYATKTNKEGVAKIKMLTSGVWLVTTSHIKPYPDSTECDTYKFSSSLTFEIP